MPDTTTDTPRFSLEGLQKASMQGNAHALLVWLTGLAIIVFCWLIISWNITNFLNTREAAVRSDAGRLSHALQQQFGQTLNTIETVMSILSRQISTSGKIGASTLLQQNAGHLPAFLSLVFIDADGIGIASSIADFKPGTSFADRDYYRVHAEGSVNGTYIGAPLIGRTLGKQFFPISQRVETADGRFLGVLMGSVDPAFLAKIFTDYIQGANGALSLANTRSKQIVARAPAHEKHFGQDISKSKLFTGLLESREGVYEVPTTTDGVTRIIAYHQLEAAPFVMLVGYAREDLRREYAAEIRTHIVTGILLSILLASLAWLLVRTDKNRRQKEETLRKLFSAVEQSPTSIFITDLKGNIEYVNQKFVDITGYSRAEARNQNPRILQSGQTPPERYKELWAALTAGQSWHGELLNRKKNGEPYWESAMIGPVRQADDRITHYLAITEDITAKKDVEMQLQQAKTAAESANLAKSQFLATMSHEIRTPMNGILGMAQLLTMGEVTEAERHEYAGVINASGQTLLRVLNDILDMSKVEAGKMELAPAVFSPKQLLAEIAALFSKPAAEKSLDITYQWQGPGQATYYADPIRLRQMLSNLVGNAIKFTATGFIQIEAKAIEEVDGRICLEFSVTDSGIGLSPEQQNQLFQPFVQVDGSATRRFDGSGLGLSIVARLSELMGGATGVDSTPGKGSRFWFRIVCTREETVHDETNPPNAVTPVTEDKPPSPGCHILVAEDNKTNRMVIQSLLHKLGHSTICVENGAEAVATIEQGLRPDLILMDCQMPVMDGYAATQRIREIQTAEQWPRLPIIALTASAFDEYRTRAMTAGMDDFLTKPVNANTLSRMLHDWTKRP